jgi:transcriptional regulator with XRE-family HTH domain
MHFTNVLKYSAQDEDFTKSRNGEKKKGMAQSQVSKVRIRKPLIRLEKQRRGRKKLPLDKEIAQAAGIAPSTYSGFKAEKNDKRMSATLAQIVALARYFRVPVETFFEESPGLFLHELHGVRWKLRGEVSGTREQALRLAAIGVLFGEPIEEIAEWIRRLRESAGFTAAPLDDRELRWMTRGALGLGLVEFVLSESQDEIRDDDLASELCAALQATPDAQERQLRTPEVAVVRNLASETLTLDPIAPFLIARVAHRMVADFLRQHPAAFTLGIAGGFHVGTFVRTIGAVSSPFPDTPGSDKRFTIVPLTLEPMFEHRFILADALAGEMVGRVAQLLGPGRVDAPSFKPFGYLVDREIRPLVTDSVIRVRQHYGDLSVAVFGCGDKSEDGWISYMLSSLGLTPEPPHTPETDICLNMLSGNAEHTPLPDDGNAKRRFLGVGMQELHRLTASPDKLALLLASGEKKGLPLSIALRAGCASAVVCDQLTARAAIEALKKVKRESVQGGRAATPPRKGLG